MSTRRIFVYGTLRPGEGNYWIESAVEDLEERCTARGTMRFVFHTGGYPVVDFDLTEHTIVGTLLWMDDETRHFRDMMEMELGAGYQEREIEVTRADGSKVTATAFHYPRIERCGELVPFQDWKRRRDLARG